MDSREAPRRIKEHLSVQTVGAETLVYDERRHKAFCLNRSCSVIWRLSTGEHTVAEMVALASAELGAQIGEEFVSFAVEELRRDGLIETIRAAEVAQPISRRAVLQRLGVGGAMLLPAVAAIVAPTAAQAYSGCFDCSDSEALRARRLGRANQIARERNQQWNSANNFDTTSSNSAAGTLSLFPQPEDDSPYDDPPR
ncbi:MAG: PqqD family protein [Acidobacteriaceae bacterium]|jgi:hypothetical protein